MGMKMKIVKRPSEGTAQESLNVLRSLEGKTNQEVSDILLLAIVMHFEQSVDKNFQFEAACGFASAFVANFAERSNSVNDTTAH
jgi:hypothetical protein